MLPRVLTVDGARRAGFSERQVRTELARVRWRLMAPGVYLARPDPAERADWIRAGRALEPRAVLSGWDATRAHLLGDAHPPGSTVLFLSSGARNRVVGRVLLRASGRPLHPAYRTVDGVGRMVVPGAARAVADTALAYRTFAPVRALVTSAVQAGRCTLEELTAELDFGPRNGSAYLRRAIEDAVRGAASIAEAELVDALDDPSIPPFELNVSVRTSAGRLVGVADVLWRELRAVLEVDSHAYHAPQRGERLWTRTLSRHNRFERYRLSATHYAPVMVRRDPVGVRMEVAEWLRGRADELGIAYPTRRVDVPRLPFVVDLST